MSLLAMTEGKLPPGFRFHPRDDELVCDYLVRSCISAGDGGCHRMMVDVDLNKCEPWDLPEIARVGGRPEWYFLSRRDRKYATGRRTNRATESGYWKATGRDRAVSRRGVVVGMRKTLVFYKGRAPGGAKTHWVMHEFCLVLPAAASLCHLNLSSFQEGRVLCRVFYKSRSGRLMNNSKPTMEEEEQEQEPTSELLSYQQLPVSCFSDLTEPLRPAHEGHVGALPSPSPSSSSDNKLMSAAWSYITMNPRGEEVQLLPCFTAGNDASSSMWCNSAQYFI